MINTYKEYLKSVKSLSLEVMQQIHEDMIDEIGNDEEALELYDDLVKTATRYAYIRSEWSLLSRQEKMDKDTYRTSSHNSVIIHFNMLARYLKMQGKAASWRTALGNEEADRYYRKTIGDFACYIVFINSISMR